MKRVLLHAVPVLILSLFVSTSASAFPVKGRALFIGDIMAHRQQLEAAEARGAGGAKS